MCIYKCNFVRLLINHTFTQKQIFMEIEAYKKRLEDRFKRYVSIDTQSDASSPTTPSTDKQKILSKILVEELLAMGISDAHMDENGYIYATIPSNVTHSVPVICFCSHVDTAPDCTGTDVKPIVHSNYRGGPIVLPDDNTIVITPEDFPHLNKCIGHDIISASGLTLLGSDDKSGVAEIMQAAEILMQNPDIKHGKIRIMFTPDEEIGRGVDKADMEKLGADFGYTLDGGEPGCIEDETFSADAVVLHIKGVSIHPGYAKEQMENAIKIGAEIINRLPKYTLCPEQTIGKQGFIHPTSISGELGSAKLEFIIRDFDTAKLKEYESHLETIVKSVLLGYPGSSYSMEVIEQYRNMKEVLDQFPFVISNAEKAITQSGLSVIKDSIRGGTDGSRLSFMGLPCPNLFAGMQGIHSKREWVSLQDMLKATEVIIKLSQIWSEEAVRA